MTDADWARWWEHVARVMAQELGRVTAAYQRGWSRG